MNENQMAEKIFNLCMKIHRFLGPGLFESVYEEILCYELKKNGFEFTRQAELPVIYEEVRLDLGFRTDIVVENKIILEIKSIETINPVHYKQLLTYLKLTGLKLGLLINFNSPLLKDGVKRVVNSL